jgi:hypothetical protein
MDAQLSYDPRSDVLRASCAYDLSDATAVPLRELVILLSPDGAVLAIDVIDFTAFARKYLVADAQVSGEALFQSVRGDLERLLAPWFENIGPLAAETIGKWDAPFAQD